MFKRDLLRNIAFSLLLLLLGGGHVLAQGTFEISSWTVDGGTVQGSIFTLHGTVSQLDNAVLTGGEFRLYGGFWAPATTTSSSQQGLYLPAISSE